LIGYFPGVRFLGDPADYEGLYSFGYRLKAVFLDSENKYAFFWSSGIVGDFPLHNYMTEFILSRLGGSSGAILAPRGSAVLVADIYKFGYVFEVETGLKRDLSALVRRLRTYREFCYVVVPNLRLKARYRASLPSFHGRINSLLEFSRSFTVPDAFF
jgi:hypothetical protein